MSFWTVDRVEPSAFLQDHPLLPHPFTFGQTLTQMTPVTLGLTSAIFMLFFMKYFLKSLQRLFLSCRVLYQLINNYDRL